MIFDVAIALMARAPEPGMAKTRLIPELGATGAAQMHAILTRRALAAIAATGMRGALWCDPGPDHPFFAECAKDYHVALHAQCEGDLGVRMHDIFLRTQRPVLLMGADCPAISAPLLHICAQNLGRYPAVFLPTVDGGYGLVALERPVPEIFVDMPWGADNVMALTRARLAKLGLAWAEPAEIWDIDTPADLARLAALDIPIPPYQD
ncbi:MAG: TIGR04282 family arsenosugar biosynthesis glycosyltransferase [Rhodoblastus sp.]